MWDQYKKTFIGMQFLILLITAGIYFKFGHIWQMSAIFFVTMQVGNLLGAMWATRLRNKRMSSALGLK